VTRSNLPDVLRSRSSIRLPNNWEPRWYQNSLWDFLQAGGKRAIAIWHRRAGKDDVALHHAACSAFERVGNYWHCLPEFEQGRKAIWTAVNSHTGKRRIDEAFPVELREATNENEMFIRFKNGSTWQVIGSDRYDATLGSSTVGITYSEWALANPQAWAYHRPILEENDGWALFITTPRGRNHAKALYDYAKHGNDSRWFGQLLTIKDTGALTRQQCRDALSEYQQLFGEDVGRAQYEQEYLCSFNAAILGAYFALEMQRVRSEDRVQPVPADLHAPVHRAWDIGVRDDTSIWWWQQQGAQIMILDDYSASQMGVEHFADEVRQRREQYGWLDGNDYVPHDAKVKEWGSSRTRIESMQLYGLHPLLVPNATFQDGIEAARRTLPFCVFHPRCEAHGLAALEQYRREWDPERKAFRTTDVHDWCSHPAAAFRYLGLAWRPLSVPSYRPRTRSRGWIIPPPEEVVTHRGIRL